MNKVTLTVQPGQTVEIVAPEAQQRMETWQQRFYLVHSMVRDNVEYVTSTEACTCPDFINRDRTCKHMRMVENTSPALLQEVPFRYFLREYREALKCTKCERLQTMIALSQ
jgi:predicted nucleic acid-binding Zn finger protein